MIPWDWIGIVTILIDTRCITSTNGMITRNPGARRPSTRPSRNNTPCSYCLMIRTERTRKIISTTRMPTTVDRMMLMLGTPMDGATCPAGRAAAASPPGCPSVIRSGSGSRPPCEGTSARRAGTVGGRGAQTDGRRRTANTTSTAPATSARAAPTNRPIHTQCRCGSRHAHGQLDGDGPAAVGVHHRDHPPPVGRRPRQLLGPGPGRRGDPEGLLRGRCGGCPAGKPLLHGLAGAEIDHPFAVDGGEVARDGVGRADADEGARTCRGGPDPHVAPGPRRGRPRRESAAGREPCSSIGSKTRA